MMLLDSARNLLLSQDARTYKNVHRTPLSYYGAKIQFANKIVSALESVQHDVYIEPFAGSAATFFAKPNTQSYSMLSDINPWVIAALRAIQDQPIEYIGALPREIDQPTYVDSAIAVQNSRLTGDNIVDGKHGMIAWMAAFNNNPWNASLSQRACNAYKESYDNGVLFARILHAHDKLQQHVIIEECDAIDQINRESRDGVLFFCDPPYMTMGMGGRSRGLGSSGYGVWDAGELTHYLLIDAIEDGMRRGAQFILTTGHDILYVERLAHLGFVLLDGQNMHTNEPGSGGNASAKHLLWAHRDVLMEHGARQKDLFMV